MYISLIRSVILYFVIVITLRLMGKRQIGELQPSELVVTILLSEIISIPMQDPGIPLVSALIPVFVFVSLEIILSVLAIKLPRLRSLVSGHPIMIIRDGQLDQKQMKRVRLNITDLMEELRLKNIFSLDEVQYAILETNGALSVVPKPLYKPLTPQSMDMELPADAGLPFVVISDGRIIETGFEGCSMHESEIKKVLDKQHLKPEHVLIMTADKQHNYIIVKKDDAN